MLSLSEIVVSKSHRVGGNRFDEARQHAQQAVEADPGGDSERAIVVRDAVATLSPR